jgi:hypothetical protein
MSASRSSRTSSSTSSVGTFGERMTRSGGATGGTGGGSATGGSGSGSGSLSDSGPSKGASKGSGGSASRDTRDVGAASLCTFVVTGQRFALTTSLVRELVEVTAVTRVPRTDVALLGLFNLRGEPMPLVDMAMVLGIGASGPSPKMPVMIVRSEGMSVGARIDALGNVVPNAGVIANSDQNPLLLGFLPAKGGDSAVAVINPVEFLIRLERLKKTTSERE